MTKRQQYPNVRFTNDSQENLLAAKYQLSQQSSRGRHLGGVTSAPVLADPPGSPFADYNAESLSTGTVTTWPNDGSDATGDLNTNPGSANNPECIADMADSLIAGTAAKYVQFNSSNSEALQGALTTTRTGEIILACVMRWNGTVSSDHQTLFDGDHADRRLQIRRENSATGGWSLYNGGTFNVGGAKVEEDKWVRIVGRVAVDALLSIERADRSSAVDTTGVDDLSGVTIGSRYDGDIFGNCDVARLVFWEDNTTLLEIEQWLEENYTFDAVPPGNPIHWWDPNDYEIGSITTVTDKGSGGVNLTATNISIIAANGCPEQKAFDFDAASSSEMEDTGDFDLGTGDQHAFCGMIYHSDTDVNRSWMGNRTGGTSWHVHKGSGNIINRDFGTNVNAVDFDTTGEFQTTIRWAYFGLFTNGASAGQTRIDDTTGGNSASGGNNPDSISIGKDDSSGASSFDGEMGDIFVYTGAEASTDRLAEVQDWLRRHRRLASQPATPIGDFDAVGLTIGTLTTWANDGSLGGSLAVPGGKNAPEAFDSGGTDNLAYVAFDGQTNNERMTTAWGNQSDAIFFTMVSRLVGTSSPTEWFFDGGTDGVNTHGMRTSNTPAGSVALNGGANLNGTASTRDATWHNFTGKFANDGTGELIIDGTTTAGPGNTGTDTLDGLSIAQRHAGDNGADEEITRFVLWGSGSVTLAQVDEWVTRRYPNTNPFSD